MRERERYKKEERAGETEREIKIESGEILKIGRGRGKRVESERLVGRWVDKNKERAREIDWKIKGVSHCGEETDR